MGLTDFAKGAFKSLTSVGRVNGYNFPVGTYINLDSNEGERVFLFTYPNKTEERISHDMIKCATILAIGVIDIKQNGNQTTLIYGTKYLVVFNDGRQAVLTVGLGEALYKIESVLF